MDDGTGTTWGNNRDIQDGAGYGNYSNYDVIVYPGNVVDVIYKSYTFGTYYIVSVIGSDNYNHQLLDVNRNVLGSITHVAHTQGTEFNPVPSIQVGSGNSNFVRDDYITWLFIRQYASLEPTWEL